LQRTIHGQSPTESNLRREALMTARCDLDSLYGETLRHLVTLEDPHDDGITLSRDTLAVPPTHLETSRLVIAKTHHDYNSWYRADAVHIHLSHWTARLLGLHLVACILHRPGRSELFLSHPLSAIRRIVVSEGPVDAADPPFGLTSVPSLFRYNFEPVARHPWSREPVPICDLPLLALTNEADLIISEQDWATRNTLLIASTTAGNVRLAELLLNAGSRLNPEVEFELEGDAGFRGVAPMSAEVLLVLPGSIAWLHDDLLDVVPDRA